MAKFTFNIDPDFVKSLGRMADVEEYAPKMIDEAIPILEKNFKAEALKHRDTGDMVQSIKSTKAGKSKYGGYYAVTRPTGYASRGWKYSRTKKNAGKQEKLLNMEKLVYLEYGTSDQPATPILTKAINDSEKPVMEKMQEVFNREVGLK